MNYYEQQIREQQDRNVVDYLPAVRNMAYRLKDRLPDSVEVVDLISVATEELIKASRRYNDKLNDNFWGYVKQRVYGSMLDYLRSLDIVSRGDRKLIKAVNKEIEIYFAKHQEEPDDDYLADKLGVEVDKIKQARVASDIYVTMPVEEQLNYFSDIEKKVEEEELISIITKILRDFSERDQMIIQLYYFEELTLKEISEILDITESRISQIHKEIIRKIKAKING